MTHLSDSLPHQVLCCPGLATLFDPCLSSIYGLECSHHLCLSGYCLLMFYTSVTLWPDICLCVTLSSLWPSYPVILALCLYHQHMLLMHDQCLCLSLSGWQLTRPLITLVTCPVHPAPQAFPFVFPHLLDPDHDVTL